MKYKFFNFKTFSWKKYLAETLSIFIAVFSAFALNNWNQNNRDLNAEVSVLKEVKSAIIDDLRAIDNNRRGNMLSREAIFFMRKLIDNKTISLDSTALYYDCLFEDYKFLYNKTGVEGLNSKGLEIIEDDKLRNKITYYYNYFFDFYMKTQEENGKAEVYKNYFFPVNDILVKYLVFNEKGQLYRIKQPITLSHIEKNKLLTYLWQIESGRDLKIELYEVFEDRLKKLEERVSNTLNEKLGVEPTKKPISKKDSISNK